ncbi:universal stress protein [Flavobacterium sp.]|uniref:universal stress protein n=1 Tax=Flavobacterium sp. TaxID=239 RepID=UPI0039E32ED3
MKKILFPTDFSKNSLNAFVYALHLTKKTNAEIVTLHVYPIIAGTYGDYYDFIYENYDINELAQFENYKSEVPKLRMLAEKEQCQSVRVSHILKQGDAVNEILDVAEKEKTDMIVMGTTGASGVKEVFLGTVTEKVMNHAKTLVLAVPEKARYQNVKNLLFLAELDKLQTTALKQVEQLAEPFKAHIDVLQIKGKHNDEEESLLKKWKKHFLKSDIYFYILASASIEDTAIDFVRLNKIDIVAMPVHEKNFFERLFLFSLSRQMAFHSQVPVLAIHTK